MSLSVLHLQTIHRIKGFDSYLAVSVVVTDDKFSQGDIVIGRLDTTDLHSSSQSHHCLVRLLKQTAE